MRIRYELTLDDLYELQLQVLHARRVRWQNTAATRWILLPVLAVTALIVWPLFQWFVASDAVLRHWSPASRLVLYAAILAIGGGVLWAAFPLLANPGLRPQWPRLHAWLARRQLKKAAAGSVLGPTTLELTDAGFVRTNAESSLEIAWDRVRGIRRSAGLISLEIDRSRRYLIVPRRAFADSAAEEEFLARAASRAGVEIIEMEIAR